MRTSKSSPRDKNVLLYLHESKALENGNKILFYHFSEKKEG